MRYAAKVDKNQAEIVAALREYGCDVLPLHAVGGGVPDLLWHCRDVYGLIEVKCVDGKAQNKYRDERCLTAKQKEWHAHWGGQIAIVWDSNEAILAVSERLRGKSKNRSSDGPE